MELNLKLLTKLFYNNHKSLFLSDIPEHTDSQQVRVYAGQSSKSPSSSSSQIHCKDQHLNPLEITFNTLKTITKHSEKLNYYHCTIISCTLTNISHFDSRYC